MNYWVLSPNVEQDASVEQQWKNAILKYEIAIMGWDIDNSFGSRFVNEVKSGDVILIAQGGNANKRLFLSGEVKNSPIKGKLPDMPNSKYFCYLDGGLNKTELNSLNLNFGGAAWGDASRIPALYIFKPWENTADKKICDKLLIAIKKKKIQNIMQKIILTDKSKKQLQLLYKTFATKYNAKDILDLNNESTTIITEFQIYLDKIKNDSFVLDDYTNRKLNGTGLPGSYLCNFLERRSREQFGSSKPAGSALSFGIKSDFNADSFTINSIDPKNDNKNNRVEAEAEFDKYKIFFKNIVNESDVYQQMKMIEECDFISAKQILRKFLVLTHPFDFIYAYNDKLDDLYEYIFGDDQSLTKSEKSYHINIAMKNILSLNQKADYATQIILSRFLWKLASSQSLVSKNNPNVILYGPPGTGKTYLVKKDLDFLTKGDSSRVKYVIFHPSYGYEDFIEGIKPCGVTESGNLQFELINGTFKEFCKLAKSRPEEEFYFVVDEINRANLSAVFGETLVCLESSYRDVVKNNFQERHLFSTQYSSYQEQLDDKKKVELAYELSPDGDVLFGVPDNLYFIGMMNNVDKNIDSFDLALRRRFKWIYFGCDYEVIENIKNASGELFTNRVDYATACKDLNEFISDPKYLGLGKSFEFGHSLYMKITTIEKQKYIQKKSIDQLFKEFLLPTLTEYLRAYYDEAEIEAKLEEAKKYFKL